MNKKIILYLALMVLGLYAMPNTVALFAGQHAFYSGMGVSCDKCHSDVLTQIEASGYVYQRHRAAAGNPNYTTYLSIGGTNYSNGVIKSYDGKTWIWNGNAWTNGTQTRLVNLDKNNDGINGDEICMLCHNATLTGSFTHSGIVVTVCDDDRCHGNRINAFNSPELLGSTSNITAAGYNLSKTNIHQPFYLGASNQSSSYAADTAFGPPGNANGSSGFTSRGHWTCEGCHTDTVADINIIQAPMYNHSDPNAAKNRY
jgi:hypothetical protein